MFGLEVRDFNGRGPNELALAGEEITMRSTTAIALSFLIGLAAVLGGATAAAETKWEMTSGYPESNYVTKNLSMFIQDVKQATDGKLEINLHSNQSLFKLPEIKRAVQTGQVQIGEIFSVLHSNDDPLYELNAIPFLAYRTEDAKVLWEVNRPYIMESFQKQGMRFLFGQTWPIQGFYTKKPLKSFADVKGLKFRIYSQMIRRMAEEMGTIPVTVQFSEVPQAFATGVIDMMYTSPQTGIDAQAWDFTKYFTNVGGNRTMTFVVANERAFRSLDPKLQQAVLDAAARAEARTWRQSDEITEEQLQLLVQKGMIVVKPTPELQATLDRIGGMLVQEWLKIAGPRGEEVIRKFQAARKKS